MTLIFVKVTIPYACGHVHVAATTEDHVLCWVMMLEHILTNSCNLQVDYLTSSPAHIPNASAGDLTWSDLQTLMKILPPLSDLVLRQNPMGEREKSKVKPILHSLL